jgi:hypothetical protein
VQQKTGTQISIQTLRRIGKQQVGVTMKHTKKRTSDESECTHTVNKEREYVCVTQELMLFHFVFSVCR